uniref:PH domain-containing protein n=1 Tax=Chromera velia CCMP2878 TaxID=1169474 RepID=A0A0G4G179_9ALVE|eukprot:Cvel_19584.t1-p1 / transcript=Cvel_19584.t1 / gene=Cvel_19584 / organism=Chromera_velia_CCMP2878 / gene_product=hypothetical protein / transcript_product=hypothetical protein / location=Cvel_scaffold1700:14803-40796(-) / protein_length=2564 / sequence_SO=supercontig / SO=protein_coding / is_pseudo=false
MKPPATDSPLPASPPKRCSPQRAKRPESPRAQAAIARERNSLTAAPAPLQTAKAETANTAPPGLPPTMLTVSPPEAVAQPTTSDQQTPQPVSQNSPESAPGKSAVPSTKQTGVDAPRPPSRGASTEAAHLLRSPKGASTETPTNQYLSPVLSPAQATASVGGKSLGGQRISAASCAKTEEEAEREISPGGLLEDLSLTESAREAAARLQMATRDAPSPPLPPASTVPEPEDAPLPAFPSPISKPLDEKEREKKMDEAIASFGKDEMKETTELLHSVRHPQEKKDGPVEVDQIEIDAEGVKVGDCASPVLGAVHVEDVLVDEAVTQGVQDGEGEGGVMGHPAELQVSPPPVIFTPTTDGMNTQMEPQEDAVGVSSSALESDPIIQQLHAGSRVEKLDFGKKRSEAVVLKLVEDRGQGASSSGCCACGSRPKPAARQGVYNSGEERSARAKGNKVARGKEEAGGGKREAEMSTTKEKREGGGAVLFSFLEWTREKKKKRSGVSLRELAAALVASKKEQINPQSPKKWQKGKKGTDQEASPPSPVREERETPPLNVEECVAELVCLGKSPKVRSRGLSDSIEQKGGKQKEATSEDDRFFYLCHPTKQRTFDFQAPDAGTASLWVAGLRLVLTHLLSTTFFPSVTALAANPGGEDGGDQNGMRRASHASVEGDGQFPLSLGRQTGDDSVAPFRGSSGIGFVPADSVGPHEDAGRVSDGGHAARVHTSLLSQAGGPGGDPIHAAAAAAAGRRGSNTSSLKDSGVHRAKKGQAATHGAPQGEEGASASVSLPAESGGPPTAGAGLGEEGKGEEERSMLRNSSPAPHALPPLTVAFCFAPVEGLAPAVGLPGGVPHSKGPESALAHGKDKKGGRLSGGRLQPQFPPFMPVHWSWGAYDDGAHQRELPSSYRRQTTAESNQSTTFSSGLSLRSGIASEHRMMEEAIELAEEQQGEGEGGKEEQNPKESPGGGADLSLNQIRKGLRRSIDAFLRESRHQSQILQPGVLAQLQRPWEDAAVEPSRVLQGIPPPPPQYAPEGDCDSVRSVTTSGSSSVPPPIQKKAKGLEESTQHQMPPIARANDGETLLQPEPEQSLQNAPPILMSHSEGHLAFDTAALSLGLSKGSKIASRLSQQGEVEGERRRSKSSSLSPSTLDGRSSNRQHRSHHASSSHRSSHRSSRRRSLRDREDGNFSSSTALLPLSIREDEREGEERNVQSSVSAADRGEQEEGEDRRRSSRRSHSHSRSRSRTHSRSGTHTHSHSRTESHSRSRSRTHSHRSRHSREEDGMELRRTEAEANRHSQSPHRHSSGAPKSSNVASSPTRTLRSVQSAYHNFGQQSFAESAREPRLSVFSEGVEGSRRRSSSASQKKQSQGPNTHSDAGSLPPQRESSTRSQGQSVSRDMRGGEPQASFGLRRSSQKANSSQKQRSITTLSRGSTSTHHRPSRGGIPSLPAVLEESREEEEEEEINDQLQQQGERRRSSSKEGVGGVIPFTPGSLLDSPAAGETGSPVPFSSDAVEMTLGTMGESRAASNTKTAGSLFASKQMNGEMSHHERGGSSQLDASGVRGVGASFMSVGGGAQMETWEDRQRGESGVSKAVSGVSWDGKTDKGEEDSGDSVPFESAGSARFSTLQETNLQSASQALSADSFPLQSRDFPSQQGGGREEGAQMSSQLHPSSQTLQSRLFPSRDDEGEGHRSGTVSGSRSLHETAAVAGFEDPPGELLKREQGEGQMSSMEGEGEVQEGENIGESLSGLSATRPSEFQSERFILDGPTKEKEEKEKEIDRKNEDEDEDEDDLDEEEEDEKNMPLFPAALSMASASMIDFQTSMESRMGSSFSVLKEGGILSSDVQRIRRESIASKRMSRMMTRSRLSLLTGGGGSPIPNNGLLSVSPSPSNGRVSVSQSSIPRVSTRAFDPVVSESEKRRSVEEERQAPHIDADVNQRDSLEGQTLHPSSYDGYQNVHRESAGRSTSLQGLQDSVASANRPGVFPGLSSFNQRESAFGGGTAEAYQEGGSLQMSKRGKPPTLEFHTQNSMSGMEAERRGTNSSSGKASESFPVPLAEEDYVFDLNPLSGSKTKTTKPNHEEKNPLHGKDRGSVSSLSNTQIPNSASLQDHQPTFPALSVSGRVVEEAVVGTVKPESPSPSGDFASVREKQREKRNQKETEEGATQAETMNQVGGPSSVPFRGFPDMEEEDKEREADRLSENRQVSADAVESGEKEDAKKDGKKEERTANVDPSIFPAAALAGVAAKEGQREKENADIAAREEQREREKAEIAEREEQKEKERAERRQREAERREKERQEALEREQKRKEQREREIEREKELEEQRLKEKEARRVAREQEEVRRREEREEREKEREQRREIEREREKKRKEEREQERERETIREEERKKEKEARRAAREEEDARRRAEREERREKERNERRSQRDSDSTAQTAGAAVAGAAAGVGGLYALRKLEHSDSGSSSYTSGSYSEDSGSDGETVGSISYSDESGRTLSSSDLSGSVGRSEEEEDRVGAGSSEGSNLEYSSSSYTCGSGSGSFGSSLASSGDFSSGMGSSSMSYTGSSSGSSR